MLDGNNIVIDASIPKLNELVTVRDTDLTAKLAKSEWSTSSAGRNIVSIQVW